MKKAKRRQKIAASASPKGRRPKFAHFKPLPELLFSESDKLLGLNPVAAQALLVSDKASFYGHRSAIFAGFCEWVVMPNDTSAICDALRLQASRSLAKLEPKASDALSVRADNKYQEFLTRLYDPIGGLAAMNLAYKRAPKIAQRRASARHAISRLIGIMAILHCHIQNLRTDSQNELTYPSIDRARQLLLGLKLIPPVKENTKKAPKEELGIKQIRNYWRDQHPSIAYLYAADRISLGDYSLLDGLLDNKITFNSVKSKLPIWRDYARFVSHEILNEMHLPKNQRERLGIDRKSLSAGTEPPLRSFTDKDRSKIVDLFRKVTKQG